MRRWRLLPPIGATAVVCLGVVLSWGVAGDAARTTLSASERFDLLDEREGFGRDAGDGAEDWPVVLVTNLDDAGAGSLRDAAGRRRHWVRFAPELRGTIELSRPLSLVGDQVLDGRGAAITLRAAPGTDLVRIHEVDNVVLADLAFTGGEDAIQIFQGANDIWVHHVSATAAGDELVSVTGDGRRPDRITISWSRFADAGKVMLLGASETDVAHAPDRITLHHNVFAGSQDRQPLVRFARVHFYNNHVVDWGAPGTGQAVRVGADGQVASEHNVFDDRHGRPAMIPEDLGTRGRLRSSGDLTTGRTVIVERLPDTVFDPREQYPYLLDEAGPALRAALAEGAGPRPAT